MKKSLTNRIGSGLEVSDFTQLEIRSKERQLQDVSKKISACLKKESEINARLSQLRKNSRDMERVQREISDLEKRLSETLREHERHERDRARLSQDLDRLQKSLEWEASLHREEEKRRQRQKKAKDDFSRIAAVSAGAMAGTVAKSGQSQRRKGQKQNRSGCLGILIKGFLFFIIVGGIVNAVSLQGSENSQTRKRIESTATPEVIQQGNGLAQWIGLTAGDIFALYGNNFSTSYLSGGSYFCYMDNDACPYDFFYYEDGEEIKPENLIYEVATWGSGAYITGNIQIGDSLSQVEQDVGYPLGPEAYEGSDSYPFLEADIQVDDVDYHLLFSPESKNLVRATAIKWK